MQQTASDRARWSDVKRSWNSTFTCHGAPRLATPCQRQLLF